MIFVFDKDNNFLERIDDLSCVLDDAKVEQLNGEYSFEFTVNIDSVLFPYLVEMNRVGFIKDDKFDMFIIRTINDSKMDIASRNVYCEHLSYELHENIVEDRRVEDGKAIIAVEKALDGSDWKVGVVEEFGYRNINFYYSNSKTNLSEVANTYGGELRYRIELDSGGTKIANKYVDLLHSRGSETGERFHFNKNLEAITRTVETLEMKNALIGRGKAPETENGGYSRRITFEDISWSVSDGKPVDKPLGQKWVGDPDLIAKYGLLMGVYECEAETPEELLEQTYEQMQNLKNPKVTYEGEIGEFGSELELGDSIYVIDEDLGFMHETRVIEIKESLFPEEPTIIKLGNFVDMLSGITMEDVKQEIDKVKDQISVVDKPITDTSFPNTIPAKQTVKATGLFSSISVEWTYENVSYYEYELYASKTKGFVPSSSNRIYRGKASSYLHYVTPNETWYYRLCGVNTRGTKGEYSNEVQASSRVINDSSTYFAEASILDASIGELRLDRGWVGELEGHRIDAKNLSVTNGNGVKTLDIDAEGNVSIVAKQINIAVDGGGNIASKNELNQAVGNMASKNELNQAVGNMASKNELNQAIGNMASKDQLNDALENVVNKEDLNETLTLIEQQIKSTIEANQTTMDYINNITSDNYITESERADIDQVLNQVQHQYNKIIDTVDKFDNSYFDRYRAELVQAYNELQTLGESLTIGGATVGLFEFRNKLTTYYNKYHDCLYAISNLTKDELTHLQSEMSVHAGKIEMALSQSGLVNDSMVEIKKHMTFTIEGWLELYGSINGVQSPFKMQLSDRKLAFWDNGNEVAYVSNRKLNIETAEIKQELQVGNYIMVKSAKNGIVFRKGV